MSDVRLWSDVGDLERRTRSRDPESSWEAAAIKRDDASEISTFILQLLRQRGPLTDDAIYEMYLRAGGTRTPQRLRTERAGLLFPRSGSPLVRAAAVGGTSRLGNRCLRWEAIA